MDKIGFEIISVKRGIVVKIIADLGLTGLINIGKPCPNGKMLRL